MVLQAASSLQCAGGLLHVQSSKFHPPLLLPLTWWAPSVATGPGGPPSLHIRALTWAPHLLGPSPGGPPPSISEPALTWWPPPSISEPALTWWPPSLHIRTCPHLVAPLPPYQNLPSPGGPPPSISEPALTWWPPSLHIRTCPHLVAPLPPYQNLPSPGGRTCPHLVAPLTPYQNLPSPGGPPHSISEPALTWWPPSLHIGSWWALHL